MSVFFRLSLLVCLTYSHGTQAEPFDLFNQDRGKEPVKTVITPVAPSTVVKAAPKPPPTPPVALKPQQDFMLKGISYLSKKHRVILQLPNGKERLISWQAQQKRPIPDFLAYKLIDVNLNTKEVKIEYPKASPCRKNNEIKGVICETADIAKLSFVYGKPTAVRAPLTPSPIPVQAPAGNNTNSNTAKNQNDLVQRFEKQVIGDDDIPDGMRRVRTPFGDRLVPEKP